MAIGTMTKQSAEEDWRSWDFTEGLAGATISQILSVDNVNQQTIDGSVPVVIAQQVVASPFVNLFLTGGSRKEQYLITVTVRDSGGQKLILPALLFVQDQTPTQGN